MLDAKQIKESLTPQNIYDLLDYYSADPEMYNEFIIARTICHGGDSKKLYYYFENQMFHCYTDCGENFDVFELVQKINSIDFAKSVKFIKDFFNLQFELSRTKPISDGEIFFDKYKIEFPVEKEPIESLKLQTYDSRILEPYPKLPIKRWLEEGIKKEVCDYAGIRYDPINGCIIIPHYDINGNLIGIRQRSLVKEDVMKYGKYRPWRKNYKEEFPHPLSMNLYGLNLVKDNIAKGGLAIIAEGEKSVLESLSFFGKKASVVVAVCGSSISKIQIDLLKSVGATEICIAFDRDFKNFGDKDYYATARKLKNINDKYKDMIDISYVFDINAELLDYKDSPLDKGKEIFLKMFRERFFL